MIVSRIYDSFVDLVCYHDIVSNVDRLDDFASRLSRLSALRSCSSVGEVGGWKWEGPLGMGKEQIGRVSSKHSSIDRGWFDPLHARPACAHACVRT